ncbi:MAG: hypothetical protein IPH20_01520 [Bacteroidales bacterium]|nr:hypothetical protein [Bacteroidales bacterium]
MPLARKSTVRKLWPYAWKVAAAVLIFASAWMLNDFNDMNGKNRLPVIEGNLHRIRP